MSFSMKLNFKFFLKTFKSYSSKLGRQYVFLVIAIVMLVIVGGFIIFSLNFLISNFNDVLLPQLTLPSILEFDIQGFEELDLIK